MAFFLNDFILDEAAAAPQTANDLQPADPTGGNQPAADTGGDAGGDDQTTDYTDDGGDDNQNNQNDQNQDNQDQNTDDNPDDDQTEDYTDDGGDDMGGGDDDMGGDDDGGGDDDSSYDSGGSGDASANKELEKELFSDLTEDELNVLNKKLKEQFIAIFDVSDNLITMVNEIPKRENLIKVIEFISNKLSELREMVTDYLTDIYHTKSYMENSIAYNQFLAVLSGINKILDEIKVEEDEN